MGSIPDVIGFLKLHNPSSLTIDLWSTQPLTDVSKRNIHRDKGWPAHKSYSLTVFCEQMI
jgi:hypothetical protein